MSVLRGSARREVSLHCHRHLAGMKHVYNSLYPSLNLIQLTNIANNFAARAFIREVQAL